MENRLHTVQMQEIQKAEDVKRTGYFRNKRYFCLLSQTDIENAIYVVMGRSIEKRTVPEMKRSTAEENDKFITNRMHYIIEYKIHILDAV